MKPLLFLILIFFTFQSCLEKNSDFSSGIKVEVTEKQLKAAYPHLKRKQAKKLLNSALRVCKKIEKQAKKKSDMELSDIHKRHCLDRQFPSLSGAIIGLYHVHIDIKKNKNRKSFYEQTIKEINQILKVSRDFPQPKPIFSLAGRILELSAFALSQNKQDLWSLGDSGNAPVVARTNLKTQKSELVLVKNAPNQDWEAMATDKYNNVWVLDVGDNHGVRKSVSLYQFDPEKVKMASVDVKKKIKIKYPDGPRDVEAAIYDKKSEKILLIGKRYFKKARVAWVDVSKKAKKKQDAVEFGRFPATGPITDAVLTDDDRLFLLTYFSIMEVKNWRNQKNRKLDFVKELFWGQVEALAMPNPDQFLVGSENGFVFELKTKKGI
jgi:hypothetical protein